MPSLQIVCIDPGWDMEVLIEDHNFLVASSKMASLSGPFREIFENPYPHVTFRFPIQPEVFLRIAQTAHGQFIPQAEISIDTLVGLSRAIRDYCIEESTLLYGLVEFCLACQIMKLQSIPEEMLPKLVEAAEGLGPEKLKSILMDIFERCGPLAGHIDTCYTLLDQVLVDAKATRSRLSLLVGPSTTLDSAPWSLSTLMSREEIYKLCPRQRQLCQDTIGIATAGMESYLNGILYVEEDYDHMAIQDKQSLLEPASPVSSSPSSVTDMAQEGTPPDDWCSIEIDLRSRTF